MITSALQKAFKFFQEHAGCVVGETAAVALRLARAEAWAKDAGVTFAWEAEPDVDLSWMDEEEQRQEHEVLACVCRGPSGETLASLGNIVDPSREHQRVVEADLALEAAKYFQPAASVELWFHGAKESAWLSDFQGPEAAVQDLLRNGCEGAADADFGTCWFSVIEAGSRRLLATIVPVPGTEEPETPAIVFWVTRYFEESKCGDGTVAAVAICPVTTKVLVQYVLTEAGRYDHTEVAECL